MSDNENENRDTVADVVAMVRWAAQSYEGEAEKSEGLLRESFELSAANYRAIASLVEAAWKREKAEVEADALSVGGIVEAARTAEKSSAVGNAAAMREALERLDALNLNVLKYPLDGDSSEIYDADKKPITLPAWGVATLLNGAKEAQVLARAALSAPARNCDRFADELDAQLAFLNEVWLISVDRETMLERDKYENWSDEMRTRYGKWLLAPAAERKGEDDGR